MCKRISFSSLELKAKNDTVFDQLMSLKKIDDMYVTCVASGSFYDSVTTDDSTAVILTITKVSVLLVNFLHPCCNTQFT